MPQTLKEKIIDVVKASTSIEKKLSVKLQLQKELYFATEIGGQFARNFHNLLFL